MKKRFTILRIRCCLLLLFATGSSFATTYTWNLVGGGAWNSAASWLPNTGYPQNSGDIANIGVTGIITTGGANFTITQLNITSGTVTLQLGVTITIDGSYPTAGTQGAITVSTGATLLDKTITTTTGTGYVIYNSGTLTHSTGTFTISGTGAGVNTSVVYSSPNGVTFQNLTINSTNNVSPVVDLQCNVTVTQVLNSNPAVSISPNYYQASGTYTGGAAGGGYTFSNGNFNFKGTTVSIPNNPITITNATVVLASTVTSGSFGQNTTIGNGGALIDNMTGTLSFPTAVRTFAVSGTGATFAMGQNAILNGGAGNTFSFITGNLYIANSAGISSTGVGGCITGFGFARNYGVATTDCYVYCGAAAQSTGTALPASFAVLWVGGSISFAGTTISGTPTLQLSQSATLTDELNFSGNNCIVALGTHSAIEQAASGAKLDLNANSLDLQGKITMVCSNVIKGSFTGSSASTLKFDRGTVAYAGSDYAVFDNGTSVQNLQFISGLTDNITLISSSANATISATSAVLINAAVNTLTAGSHVTYNTTLNINVGSTWTNNGAYTYDAVNGSTVTFNGGGAETIGGTSSTTFDNLTIINLSGLANGVTLIGNIPQFVNGVLTLNTGKIISTSSNLLTMNATATVGNGPPPSNASYVYGPVAKVIFNNADPTFTFPVGKDSLGFNAEYLPIGIGGFTGGGSNITFTSELMRRHIDFTSSPYVNYTHDAWINNVDSCEYWTLTQSGNSLAAHITGYWNSTFCLVTSPPNLRVVTINSIPNTWSDLDNYTLGQFPTINAGSTNAAGNITSQNTSSFYTAFTLASDTTDSLNPLPITLLSFTAKPRNNNDVLVEWNTASELNNAGFTVEKEIAGSSSQIISPFAPIATIEGAGNSTTAHHYEFVDDSPIKANQWWNYYRLKQTDFDGTSVYYGPIGVRLNPPTELSIYPTVSTGLFYYTGDWQNADVTVYSAEGQKVFHTKIVNEASSLDISTLLQGIYFVTIQTNDGVVQSRIIKTSEK